MPSEAHWPSHDFHKQVKAFEKLQGGQHVNDQKIGVWRAANIWQMQSIILHSFQYQVFVRIAQLGLQEMVEVVILLIRNPVLTTEALVAGIRR
jgi:hypothetical protein